MCDTTVKRSVLTKKHIKTTLEISGVKIYRGRWKEEIQHRNARDSKCGKRSKGVNTQGNKGRGTKKGQERQKRVERKI